VCGSVTDDPEVYQVFWASMAAAEFINDAAIAAGRHTISKEPVTLVSNR